MNIVWSQHWVVYTCTHTAWKNEQAALNHNTFYWSRLNSHKASLKKEIGQIRKRFSWKKVQGENTDRAWKCAMEMDVHLLWSSVRSLLHGPLLILCSYNIYQSLCCLLCHTRRFNHCFFLPSHTFSLSFCHSSKYPVGQGCGLLVLVYLVLGSIQLQAEASHSSQSHKMWLVLTTALRGDGLIGPIVSYRLVWTKYRKTTATARCGFLPFPVLSFSP